MNIVYREDKFNKFYNCKDQKTSTVGYSSTTTIVESPSNEYPTCNNKVSIAFDKSSGFTAEEYRQMQRFLIGHVFQNWTHFNNLNVYLFAEHTYSNVDMFKDTNDLVEFIQTEEQVGGNPDLCNLCYALDGNTYANVVFLSTLTGTDFDEKSKNSDYETCQDCIDTLNSETQLTIVRLNDNWNTDSLQIRVPQAQVIKLNLPEVPTNWEWQFNNAYGCNQDNFDDHITYPCNSKFIIGYDISTAVDKQVLEAQKNFLTNNVFNKHWNVFDNLALIAYSNKTIIQEFGTMSSIEDVHNFLDNSFKQNSNASRTSLCGVFKDLTAMYLFDVNIVLFVSQFHQFGDECAIWIEQLRVNINFIHFVVLNDHVNTKYLISKFAQARFTSWNTKIQDNWSIESYGCQNFIVNEQNYPCLPSADNIMVVYDRSHYLSPVAYQRLEYFLLTKVYIAQWSAIRDIYNYPRDNQSPSSSRMELELFIRRSLRSPKEPLFCSVLDDMDYDLFGDNLELKNLLFFISKFDKKVFAPNHNCKTNVESINEKSKTTFFKLGPLVDTDFLRQTFPNATIIDWNIEQDEAPKNWTEILWKAFNCSGSSSIVFPLPASTSVPPTKQHLTTSTALIKTSTTLTSSLQTTTTTTRLTTVTDHFVYTATTHSPSTAFVIVLSTLLPLFFVCLIAGIAAFCWYRKRKRDQIVNNMAFNASAKNDNETQYEEDLWEISPGDVEFFSDRQLGSGASANVYLGRLLGDSGIKRVYPNVIALRDFSDCEVAVKVLPVYATELNKEDFKQEINFMKKLYHPHIICLLGYTTDKIVLEYCENGDLMRFLKRSKDTFETGVENALKLRDLIGFAWQISSGLEYFSSLNLIHRDLAARNVLLTNDLVCKIGDFGLAREGDLRSYTNKRRMPIRWLPPEALKSSEYSVKTDVWSYAVLLYEIFTIGNLPYSELENTEILSHIDSGNRLEQPEHAFDDVYTLMKLCWNTVPDERPNFTQICQSLIPLLEQFNINYNYVNPVETVINADVEEINPLRIFDEIDDDEVTV